jgi:hypothetical protein
MVADIASDCGADRCADAYCGADYTLREIVMASAAHNISQDEGDEHAKGRGRNAIKQLDCDDKSRRAGYCKKSAADGECREAQCKQRTPAPSFGSAANGGRDCGYDELWSENAHGKNKRRAFGKAGGEETCHRWQRGGIGELEQQHGPGEDDERTITGKRPKRIRRRMHLVSRSPAARQIGVNVG